MLRYLSLVALAAVLGLGAGCSKKKQINVYMYSEYVDPELIKAFESQTGHKVNIVTYENSEEMLAKLQRAGGASEFDVIVVSDVTVPRLVSLKLVQELDKSKLPGASGVDQQFQSPPFDEGSKYSMPYQWGTVGLIYNKQQVTADTISWDLIFDPAKQPGPFILMDSQRDMLGIALRYQGHSMNTRSADEIKSAAELIQKAKKGENCLGFESGAGGKNRVADGKAVAAIVYNGDALRAVAENDKLDYCVPKEGGILWVDVMMIPAQAPNSDMAHEFMNFMLDPKNNAKLSNFNRYATPVSASLPLIAKEDREDPRIYPPAEVVKTLEYLNDMGNDTRLYTDAWNSIVKQ